MTGLGIAGHVVDRWRQRVSPGAEPATAGAEIMDFLTDAQRSRRPPGWVAFEPYPDTTYLTSPAWPGVVLVVDGSKSKAITVLADEQRVLRPKARLPYKLSHAWEGPVTVTPELVG